MHKHANKHARSSAGASKASRKQRAAKWARVAIVAATPVIGAGAVAAPAVAKPHDNPAGQYQFTTLDNQADPTFNQLLGINRHGVIAGYFGSGAMGHPNKGYLLTAPYGQANYRSENWPESTQTQVTGLNDNGVTVGFWSTMNNADNMNDNRAFVSVARLLRRWRLPHRHARRRLRSTSCWVSMTTTSRSGSTTMPAATLTRTRSTSGVTSSPRSRRPVITGPTAAGINNRGDIAGFGTDATGDSSNGQVVAFLLRRNGRVTILNVPGSSMTQALGINDNDEVVGVYQVGTGDSAVTHGFTWTAAARVPDRR